MPEIKPRKTLFNPELRRRGIYLLPNLFTTAALFCGFFAIVQAMKGGFEAAAVAIFVAMVLDGLDGRVARMTRTQSAFRCRVRFAVRHGFLRRRAGAGQLRLGAQRPGPLGWIAAFIYCAGAALRLARFNTTLEVIDKRYFQGLPSPAAAALVTAFLWVMIDKASPQLTCAGYACAGDHFCRYLDGHQRPVLQLQGRQSAAQRALHFVVAIALGFAFVSYDTPVRPVWPFRGLCALRLCPGA
jgi:CDP-diacylglycerol--serine O-phosphatidyltransferase